MPKQFSRRTMVAMLGGTTAVGPTAAWGHDLRPGDPTYRFREYEDIVNRRSQIKQVYQWPNIANEKRPLACHKTRQPGRQGGHVVRSA